MKKFIKENWFKTVIVIILLISINVYNNNQQEKKENLDWCLVKAWDNYGIFHGSINVSALLNGNEKEYLKLAQDKCFKQYK